MQSRLLRYLALQHQDARLKLFGPGLFCLGVPSWLLYGCPMGENARMPGRSGRWKFIGEPIEVATQGETHAPLCFTWKDKQYHIERVLLSWFDWNFPAGAKRRDWKSRRHRRYYRVATETGEVFEIYRDRRTSERTGDWVCYQQWVPQELESPEVDRS